MKTLMNTLNLDRNSAEYQKPQNGQEKVVKKVKKQKS